MILVVVIVSPGGLQRGGLLLWASEEWLKGFAILARSLGRPM